MLDGVLPNGFGRERRAPRETRVGSFSWGTLKKSARGSVCRVASASITSWARCRAGCQNLKGTFKKSMLGVGVLHMLPHALVEAAAALRESGVGAVGARQRRLSASAPLPLS